MVLKNNFAYLALPSNLLIPSLQYINEGNNMLVSVHKAIFTKTRAKKFSLCSLILKYSCKLHHIAMQTAKCIHKIKIINVLLVKSYITY